MTNAEDNLTLVTQALVDWEQDLRTFLFGVLREPHAVDDAYQRTVVRAMEAAAAYRDENLRGWLFQVALNEARQIRRNDGRRARRELSGDVTEEQLRQGSGDLSLRADWIVAQKIVSEELVAAVETALESLTPQVRQVLRMRLFEELTFQQIADQTKLPIGTVLSMVHRALGQLRINLQLKQFLSE
ncbi:MAG: sigma-70 family RNA polymerase sigma factor [Planctomycetaceae bacterium]|nr:sigma-70 family RNA polymerase sigma factor [Planctomycetaceae bacterium]